MYAVEKVFLSLPLLLRYDQPIWKTSPKVMHDYKRSHGHFQQSRSHAKGAPLENCFGFIDGTMRPIAHPNQHQRIVYNG